MKLIADAIKTRGAQWAPKESSVSRLSDEQIKRMLGDRSREIAGQESIKIRAAESYPESIDWRNKEGLCYVTSIKDQTSECGSCVAFDAVAALESLICIENNRPGEDIDLSEMNTFMCGCPFCCNIGWFNDQACYYMRYYGVPDEYCWPYIPEDNPCESTCSNKTLRDVQIGNYGYVLGQEAYKAAVSFAPIMTTMKVYEDFLSHGTGIYEHVWGNLKGMHSICIIGYGSSGQTPYWIVKNSWGTDWGEDGFAKIKIGECEIESGGYWISDVSLPSSPNSPSELSANSGQNGSVSLSWHDNANNEMMFELQRKSGIGDFETIENISDNTTSYQDTGVSGETAYSYRIRALNVGGPSDYSNVVDFTTPPQAPTGLEASMITDSCVTLVWQDNSPAEEGFEIWRKAGSGGYTLIETVGPDVCLADAENLTEYTVYYFKVRAFNGSGLSAWSNEVSATTLLKPPAGLIATACASDSMYLSWQDRSNKESGYEVWQQENEGNWLLKGTVAANTYVTEINGLIPGTDYCYKVRAYKNGSESDWSNISCAPTQSGVPSVPSELQVTGYCWEVELNWIDNSNNENGFNIYRQSGAEYFWIGSVGPNMTSFRDTDLPCGLRWCYKVRAFNENGNSPACSVRCAKTSPCYECQGGLVLSVVPDQATAGIGDSVTFVYRVENKGEVRIDNIIINDSSFGEITTGRTLQIGEILTITKTIVVLANITNRAKASGTYVSSMKETKYVKANALATVTVR